MKRNGILTRTIPDHQPQSRKPPTEYSPEPFLTIKPNHASHPRNARQSHSRPIKPIHASHPRHAGTAVPNIIPARRNQPRKPKPTHLPRVQRPAGLWSFFWERGVHEGNKGRAWMPDCSEVKNFPKENS